MDSPSGSASPLDTAGGAAGPQTVEAFKLLGDETRLAILLALWEAYDPHAPTETVSFSTLYDRVNVRDSGTFTYHLDKLAGNYVDAIDDGYRLTNSGQTLVRAVIAGAGIEEKQLKPTEIPRQCPHCGDAVEISYEDDRLYQICQGCEGHIGPDSMEHAPTGTLIAYDNFNPAGLTDRTPDEVFLAGSIEYHRSLTLLIRGVCPECSGPVERSVQVCEDHETGTDELCTVCGTWNEVRVVYVCSVCKLSGSYPAWVAAFDHPAVVAFYHDHGFDMTFGLDDPEECGRLWKRLMREQETLSIDPVRVLVTVEEGDDRLELTLNQELTVVDVHETTA